MLDHGFRTAGMGLCCCVFGYHFCGCVLDDDDGDDGGEMVDRLT